MRTLSNLCFVLALLTAFAFGGWMYFKLASPELLPDGFLAVWVGGYTIIGASGLLFVIGVFLRLIGHKRPRPATNSIAPGIGHPPPISTELSIPPGVGGLSLPPNAALTSAPPASLTSPPPTPPNSVPPMSWDEVPAAPPAPQHMTPPAGQPAASMLAGGLGQDEERDDEEYQDGDDATAMADVASDLLSESRQPPPRDDLPSPVVTPSTRPTPTVPPPEAIGEGGAESPANKASTRPTPIVPPPEVPDPDAFDEDATMAGDLAAMMAQFGEGGEEAMDAMFGGDGGGFEARDLGSLFDGLGEGEASAPPSGPPSNPEPAPEVNAQNELAARLKNLKQQLNTKAPVSALPAGAVKSSLKPNNKFEVPTRRVPGEEMVNSDLLNRSIDSKNNQRAVSPTLTPRRDDANHRTTPVYLKSLKNATDEDGLPMAPFDDAVGGMTADEANALWREYVEANRKVGRDLTRVKHQVFQDHLERNFTSICKRFEVEKVQFKVKIKEGRVSLQATPIRA